MTEDEGDIPSSAELFKTRLDKIQDQINTRIQALKNGLTDEVDRCREAVDPVDLAKCYANFRTSYEGIKEEIKDLNDAFAYLEEVQFPELLKARGMKNVPLEDIGRTIGMQTRTKASIVSGMKEDAILYLRADYNAVAALEAGELKIAVHNLILGGRKELAESVQERKISISDAIEQIHNTTDNLENIVQEHVFPQTLSALAKGWAEEGKELPEQFFNTYLAMTTTWRKIAS